MARRGAGVKVRAIRGLAQRMTTTSCWERVRQQTPHLALAGARKLAPTPWTPAGGPRSLGEWARPAAQAPLGLAQRMTTTSCWERVRQQTPHLVLADARKLAPTPWTTSCRPRSLGEWARPAAQAPLRPCLDARGPPCHPACNSARSTDGPLEPPAVRAVRGDGRPRAAGGV